MENSPEASVGLGNVESTEQTGRRNLKMKTTPYFMQAGIDPAQECFFNQSLCVLSLFPPSIGQLSGERRIWFQEL